MYVWWNVKFMVRFFFHDIFLNIQFFFFSLRPVKDYHRHPLVITLYILRNFRHSTHISSVRCTHLYLCTLYSVHLPWVSEIIDRFLKLSIYVLCLSINFLSVRLCPIDVKTAAEPIGPQERFIDAQNYKKKFKKYY